MSVGPGKYDDLCTYVREMSNASVALIIVMDGNKGTGFSVQATSEVANFLPAILRTVADEIQKEHFQ